MLFNFQGSIDKSTQLLFEDFAVPVEKVKKKWNEMILALVRKGGMKQNDIHKYKDDHPIQDGEVYSLMIGDHEQCHFSYDLSTAKAECGFSVLNMIHTKQRNWLTVQSVDAWLLCLGFTILNRQKVVCLHLHSLLKKLWYWINYWLGRDLKLVPTILYQFFFFFFTRW